MRDYQSGLCAQAQYKDSPKPESRTSGCLSKLELNLIALAQVVSMLDSRLCDVTNRANKHLGSSPPPPKHPPLPQESANVADRVERAAERVNYISCDLNDLLDRLEV